MYQEHYAHLREFRGVLEVFDECHQGWMKMEAKPRGFLPRIIRSHYPLRDSVSLFIELINEVRVLNL